MHSFTGAREFFIVDLQLLKNKELFPILQNSNVNIASLNFPFKKSSKK